MAAKRSGALPVPASVAAGTAVDVTDLKSIYVGIASVGTATYKLMVSFDGTTFSQYGANITADGTYAVPDAAKMCRVDCSAYTSGTPTGGFGGLIA